LGLGQRQDRFSSFFKVLSHLQPVLAEKTPGHLKITDTEALEVCLRQYTDIYRYPKPYNVVFLLKNGNTFAGGFTEADAPSFVKEYFAR